MARIIPLQALAQKFTMAPAPYALSNRIRGAQRFLSARVDIDRTALSRLLDGGNTYMCC